MFCEGTVGSAVKKLMNDNNYCYPLGQVMHSDHHMHGRKFIEFGSIFTVVKMLAALYTSFIMGHNSTLVT